MRRFVVATCMLLLLTLSGSLTLGAPGTTVLSLAASDAATSPTGDAAAKFAELLKAKTDGRLSIKFYPASQLGNEVSMIEGARMGSIDMIVLANMWLTQMEPDYSIMSLAFVFEDEAHLRRFIDSPINHALVDRVIKTNGVHIVAQNWFRTPHQIFTKRPIRTIEDLKNFKMRVPSVQIMEDYWRALGASPTRVDWGEVYFALRQGIVDGVEAPVDHAFSMKFHDVVKYCTELSTLRSYAFVGINERKFRSLSPDLQKALVEAAVEAGEYHAQSVNEKAIAVEDEMKAAGVTFLKVEVSPFAAKMDPLAYRQEAANAWSKGLYDAIQAMKRK